MTRLILIVLLLSAMRSNGEPALTVEPAHVYLGAFSALRPEQTVFTSGSSTISLLSAESNWQLRITWLEPLRRISDGLELPTQRVSEVLSDRIPSEITSFQPYMYKSGTANEDGYTEVQSWLTFQEIVQEYLRDADPPGSYRTHIRFDLTTPDGQPLAAAVTIEVELEILSVVQTVLTEPNVDIQVQFDRSDEGQGESFLFPIVVRTNGSWDLWIRSLAGAAVGRVGNLPLEMISFRTTGITEHDWQTWVPDFRPLSQQPVLLASGTAPVPFSLVEARIRLIFRAEVPISVRSGRYELPFEVRTELHATD